MKFSHRLVISLLGGVAAVSTIFAIYQANEETIALKDGIERQAEVLAESQEFSVRQLLLNRSSESLQSLVDRFRSSQRLAGMAIYDAQIHPVAISSGLTSILAVTPAAVSHAVRTGEGTGMFVSLGGQPMHVFALPLKTGSGTVGAIVVFHRAGFIGAPAWRHAFTGVAQTVLIVILTLMIIRWAFGQPLRHMADWLRDFRIRGSSVEDELPKEDIFMPLASEVRHFASSLHVARAAAEEEARLRDASLSQWTAERLRVAVQTKLRENRIFAVSNREPYEHVRKGTEIVCSVPPSGLVTALEPILRACDGTWIAQATGDADREGADASGHLRVPPEHPQYKLRRVWLSRQEEDGFYLGFANEGLWPLCHIAHTRPIFRTEDWNQYQAVNRKFAAAVIDEMNGEHQPLVLVQDYHFALLPRMLKERRPDARIAIFWHIPWPNPEAFGICPWQEQLLDGMLGADLIGFHIQAHCNNFLATVERALEARVDQEHFTVRRRDHMTTVKPFPISVAMNGEDSPAAAESPAIERARLLRQLGVEATLLGIGVDRVDYTKGIPERFRGIERLLEVHPDYAGKLTFVQIGAPSRTHIQRYQDLMTEVEREAERINRRFRIGAWSPIVFLNKHHSHAEIVPYYRGADFCLVTSLHDGMNLVAKEYVAARRDEGGSLILSRFTGASHELPDALVVNPYDTDELAQAIHTALTMPADESRVRMASMRAVVRENNVYRWAGNLIGELAEVRLELAARASGDQTVDGQQGWIAQGDVISSSLK
jgi:alpha,alpha-trehalose-phosphate synthase [UDP-forming]